MARFRAEDPTKSTSELMQVIGKEWNKLDAERKAVYTSMSAVLRTDYQKRLAAYNAGLGLTPPAAAAAPSAAKPTPTKIVKPTAKVATPVAAPVVAAVVATEEKSSKKKKRKHHEKEVEQPEPVAGPETEKKKKVGCKSKQLC
jgi:hypothetical protein